ncbi:MAG: hypothetical protein V2A74_08060 [bacterium]
MAEETPRTAASNKKELQCSSCGAPVPYLEGEALLNCPYCGMTIMLGDFDKIVKVEEHLMVPLHTDKTDVTRLCREWLSKGFLTASDADELARFDEVKGLFRPFWAVNIDAKSFWSGMDRRTRIVGSGKSQRTETYYVPVNGEFDEEFHWAVFARQDEDNYFGLEALNPGKRAFNADWGAFILNFGLGDRASDKTDLTLMAEPFNIAKTSGLEILNGQLVRDVAEQNACNGVREYHRQLASRKCSSLSNCDTTTYIRKTSLIYTPLWFVKYSYKTKAYRFLVHGGMGSIIKGEYPVGKYDKALVVTLAMGVLIAIFTLLAIHQNSRFAIGAAVAFLIAGFFWLRAAMTE